MDERHRRWSAEGTWEMLLRKLQIHADATDPDGALALARALDQGQQKRKRPGTEWAGNIDSTSCRAHQHAAEAWRRPPRDFPQKGVARAWRPMGERRWDGPGAG